MTENERVKELRKSLNLTLEEFGQKIGVGRTAISRIERSERSLTNQNRLAICREFNVNETWLRTGEGEMFLEAPDTAMGQLAKELGLDEFMQGILGEYLKLNEEQRTVVRNFVKKIAEQSIKEPAVPTLAPAHTPTIEEEARAEAEEYYRQLIKDHMSPP